MTASPATFAGALDGYALDHALTRQVYHFVPAPLHPMATPDEARQPYGCDTGPFRAVIGRRTADIMGTTCLSTRLISERTADVFRSANITGWRTVPTQVFDKDGTELSGFSILLITGHAGPLDLARTRIVKDERGSVAGEPTYLQLGFFIDERTWDGSDLYTPRGTTAICAVSRVQNVIESANLTNFQIVALSEAQVARLSTPPGNAT